MLNTTFLLVIIALLVLLLAFLFLRNNRHRHEGELARLEGEKRLAELEIKMHEMAAQQVEEYRNTFFLKEQQRIIAEQKEVALASFERWKMEYETSIRQDAIKKSQAVTIGKVTEHILPFFGGVFPYNPKEARFIGSPIDLIVFDSMETNPDNVSIHFIEVKTASSSLTPKQRAIKYAILNKRVEWKELRA